jgi:cytochrome c oxidase subunit IV
MANQIPRPQRRTLFLVYTGLIALLILTAVGAYVPMGGTLHVLLAFGVSAAKTALIAFFFMEIHYHNGITRIFAGAGLVWLALLFLLTFSDYLTRHWRF